MRRFALVLALAACSDPPAPPPLAPEPLEPVPVEPAQSAPEVPAVAPPRCAALGLSHAPVITPEAREANAAALVHHAAGRFDESEAGFRAALDASPDHGSARFNHACALARLGRGADAWAELELLLCADLPTTAPRLLSDPDLESVRAAHDVAAAIDEVAAQYRAAAGRGTPLVSFVHGPEMPSSSYVVGTEWEESQAGVWIATDGVFVPMGPLQHITGPHGTDEVAFPLIATRYDAASGRVLTVLARGNLSEGGGLFCTLQIRLTEGATGASVVDASRRVEDVFDFEAWPAGDAVMLTWQDVDSEAPSAFRATSSGIARASVSPPGPGSLAIGNLSWEHVTGRRVPAHGPLVHADGLPDLSLGPAPRWGDRSVMPSSAPGIVYVVTSRHGDCGTRDRFLVERLVPATGERRELWAGDDAYPILEEGADGALYIQAGDETRRFADHGAGNPEVLWPGLGLTSGAADVNPYC